MGWIHSIYFYLHSFLRSTAELSEITRRGKSAATAAIHTGRRVTIQTGGEEVDAVNMVKLP